MHVYARLPQVWYNASSRHAAPTYLNAASNVLRGGALGEGARRRSPGSIVVNNHPLPFTSQQRSLLDSVKALQAVLFIMMAFAFVPGGIVVYVVREQEQQHNSKHQQMVSGASILSFWLSNFAFDAVLSYSMPLALSMLAIWWVDLAALVQGGALTACFVLLLGYGPALGSPQARRRRGFAFQCKQANKNETSTQRGFA